MKSPLENFSLKKYNTFGVEARAEYFIELTSADQIREFIKTGQFKTLPFLVLGEGSNVLFTTDFNGIVIRPLIRGIEKTGETAEHVLLKVGAGENWDEFVKYCVENNLGGLENLSFIPGSVGACPVQNIGAYGVEVKDKIEYVEAIELSGNRIVKYAASECIFDYRYSIFKEKLKNKVIITRVVFRLDKEPKYVTKYGNIEKELDKYPETNLQNIRQVVINIRTEKLPDPSRLGNAGSFFKNPVVTGDTLKHIHQFYPKIPYWKIDEDKYKISAAWLIEQCHYHKKRIGRTGTYPKQPLVIVNYGQATGKDILNLAKKIQKAIKNHFAIALEPEVNII
ncbi:MAG: UDP-N-acetylmuramate dehydrogenase [Bacteroidales bacterium]|nr:UDP-N-acetylmuramate dehydrogenase [Bacteroidales bacterium]